MTRGTVFVRAVSPSGQWGTHDVLDLDQTSFNAFILESLAKAGLVASLPEPPGMGIVYRSTKEEE